MLRELSDGHRDTSTGRLIATPVLSPATGTAGPRPAERGFTLVELALVVLIGGILLGTLSAALVIYTKNAQIKTTRERLAAIDENIQLYLNINGRLPCAASLTAGVDSAAFGREVTDACATGGFSGTQLAPGRDGRQVRIGAVPVRTINLPDDYAIDAWGNRFTYAVTGILASPGSYDRAMGAADVLSSTGDTVLDPAGSAHYVVVSHGPDGAGVHTVAGVAGAACPPAAATLDAENCDDDAVFRRTLLTSTAANVSHFDDLLAFRAVSTFGQEVPPGAVMAFDLAACPPGWTPVSAAAGRFVVGVGKLDGAEYALKETGGEAQVALGIDEMPPHTHSYARPEPAANLAPGTGGNVAATVLDETGAAGNGAPHENRPPYLALLYCKKT